MASRPRRPPVSTDKRFRKISAGGDHGTAERWQHSGRTLEATEQAGILAVRATEEHVLDILALKKLINKTEVEAGLRLKNDFHAAAIAAHVTGSYSGMGDTRSLFHTEYERSDAQEEAYRRWKNAVRELGMPFGRAVIETVCYDAMPISRDLVILQEGLEKLARFYRMGKR